MQHSDPSPVAEARSWPRQAKHFRIAEELRQQVRNGKFPGQLPKMVELAEMWNVAPVTMKKAVDALKDDGVLRVVRGQGIFPTRLKRRRTHVLGSVLYTSGVSHLHTQLVHGMSRAAAIHGEAMTMGEGSMGAEEPELREVRRLCEKQQVDGIILWPTEVPKGLRAASVDYLLEEDIPFVLIPEPDLTLYPDCSSVSNVDSGAAAEIMKHLLAMGHRDIGFVHTDVERNGPPIHHRRAEYEHSLREAGCSIHPSIVLPQYPGNRQVFLLKTAEALLRRCSAVFCSTDHAAFGLLHYCLRLGIRVPEDLAVAGYDNLPLSEVIGLTTVEQHFTRIGEEAVELLLDEIEGRAQGAVHRQVPSELIIRTSTGA